ncbi:MAG: VCBS repeat-containing protein, partial [Planctomycetota bacterium]
DEGRFLGFEDVAERAGVRGTSWSYAAAAADVDQDGDTDLFVANDYGSNRLWLNAGDGTFQDGADALGVTDRGNGMGVTFGDLSGDGRLDLYVSNMSSTAGNRILGRLGDELDADVHALLKKLAAGNSIFLAGGSAEDGFQRLPRERGGIDASWAWSAALFDVELDGDLDVFCANGFITGELPFDT